MSAISESHALHERVRSLIRAFERGLPQPEGFDAVACDLARFQARNVGGYARLCAARGIDLSALSRASDAPAVPTDAFKLAPVFAFASGEAQFTFRTSGTTLGARGAHPMRDVGTYDAAALAFGRAMLLPGGTSAAAVIVIGPSAREAPDSSLAHMCNLFVRELAPDQSPAESFFVSDGALQTDRLRARVAALAGRGPAVVLATSFALVHLLDALGEERLPLPEGSRVMQTGGFKGKSREVAADELRGMVARAFAIKERAVVCEYGMTELSSQFWEMTLAADEGARIYVEPPWARVVAVADDTLAPVREGEVGIARIEDLANVDSAFAIVTQDRVRRVPGGFELLGRASHAPPRGCSIALDEMLSGYGRRP